MKWFLNVSDVHMNLIVSSFLIFIPICVFQVETLNSMGEKKPMTLQNKSFILRTNQSVYYVIFNPDCVTILLNFKALGYLPFSDISVTTGCDN